MDAVGCFEGDEEEEEEDEEEIDVDEEFCKQVLEEEGVREAGWRLDAAQGDFAPPPRGQEALCWPSQTLLHATI